MLVTAGRTLTTLTRRVILSPLSDDGRTESVTARLRSAITLGVFADGEQLPNEVALASQFAVSPVTLRDSLRTLREEGLVRTVRGRTGGTFVLAPGETQMVHYENALIALSALEVRDLIDWQITVMAAAARLSAERAQEYEVNELRRTAALIGSEDDPVTSRRAYLRFLISMAASSRSSRLSRESISLQIEYAPHATLALQDANVRAATAMAAEELTEAIASWDGDAAHKRMLALGEYLGEQVQLLHHGLSQQPNRAAPAKVME